MDCITVSTSPVKSAIDDITTKLFDTLLISLRRSIVNDYNSLDSFVTKSQEDLNQVPQTIEEMGEVNEKYQKIVAEKDEVGFCYIVCATLCVDVVDRDIELNFTIVSSKVEAPVYFW